MSTTPALQPAQCSGGVALFTGQRDSRNRRQRNQSCGCPADLAYGLVSRANGTVRVHRVTFSRSLAMFLSRSYGYDVARLRLRIGHELTGDETSASGFYAVLDRRKGTILRVALHREIAFLLADDASRYVAAVEVTCRNESMEKEKI